MRIGPRSPEVIRETTVLRAGMRVAMGMDPKLPVIYAEIAISTDRTDGR